MGDENQILAGWPARGHAFGFPDTALAPILYFIGAGGLGVGLVLATLVVPRAAILCFLGGVIAA